MEQEFTITMMHGSQFFRAVKDDITVRGDMNTDDANVFTSITNGSANINDPQHPVGDVGFDAFACNTDSPKIRWRNIDDDLIDVVKPAILEVIAALKGENAAE